jgi:hypothetical protein
MRYLEKIGGFASEASPSDSLPSFPSLHAFGGPEEDCAASNPGHALFQEWFFFCRMKRIGDAGGTECIYVETVVDRDSGVAFAKVYSARNAMKALDILTTRVVPFFSRQGIAIREMHTPNTAEYCGLPTVHPYESFLTASHIRHLGADESGQVHLHLCREFYQVLLKEFFPLALRKHFQPSLIEMQKELDVFVDAYNAPKMKRRGNA